MPESVKITFGADGAQRFDELVHHPKALPEGGDLELAVKEDATTGGAPGIVVSFTVNVHGRIGRAQAVTTLRAFMAAADVLRARYPSP